jgi:hypothetical protein
VQYSFALPENLTSAAELRHVSFLPANGFTIWYLQTVSTVFPPCRLLEFYNKRRIHCTGKEHAFHLEIPEYFGHLIPK